MGNPKALPSGILRVAFGLPLYWFLFDFALAVFAERLSD